MAKQRKTREQKKLADLRHKFVHTLTSQALPAVKIQSQPKDIIRPQRQPNQQISINKYPYLVKDLSKTGMLTLGILTSQIILFVLLKNHALTIPGISY
jgi:hypothetical protein